MRSSRIVTQIYENFAEKRRLLAVLIDPDCPENIISETVRKCNENDIDLILVGGSLITEGVLQDTVSFIKQQSAIPVMLFPGNEYQVCHLADGILFLSLLSGRNPDFLIGKHVLAAPALSRSTLEIVPTAYLLIDGGKPTSVSYMSNTSPIPADKPRIAAATALAGQLMGMKLIYMDAGSGALQSISPGMVKAVCSALDIPVIIGGGIRQANTAKKLFDAGAAMLVIGNGAEDNSDLIAEIAAVRRQGITV